MKLFQHSPTNRFHISVGAVLVNDQGEICTHLLEREKVPARFDMGGLEKAYILMRESLENDETLEQAVLRGIKEEFAAEGNIVSYLGSIQIPVQENGYSFEKTTLYFEIRLTSLGDRDLNDEEAFTTIEWIKPEELLEAMRNQGARSTRNDSDESKIIEAYVSQR